MKKIDNKKFYKKAYERYGTTSRGVHWASKSRQYLRFEVLTNFIKKNVDNSTIIDVGCGFGDYLNYLNENQIKIKSYLGIDCEGFMINLCQKKYSQYKFEKIDILKDSIPSSDYLICSGALNILNEVEFFKAIEKCFKASKKGFVFNFLTKDSFNEISLKRILEFCQKLTVNIEIENNYLENDCSILLIK
ncbi:MAG: class I SAM-dependent methyltransferase [Arcobacter sp.]|nr:MAG: class I SAM-dependent methyltransferase [Arcobacter sp.]